MATSRKPVKMSYLSFKSWNDFEDNQYSVCRCSPSSIPLAMTLWSIFERSSVIVNGLPSAACLVPWEGAPFKTASLQVMRMYLSYPENCRILPPVHNKVCKSSKILLVLNRTR